MDLLKIIRGLLYIELMNRFILLGSKSNSFSPILFDQCKKLWSTIIIIAIAFIIELWSLVIWLNEKRIKKISVSDILRI